MVTINRTRKDTLLSKQHTGKYFTQTQTIPP